MLLQQYNVDLQEKSCVPFGFQVQFCVWKHVLLHFPLIVLLLYEATRHFIIGLVSWGGDELAPILKTRWWQLQHLRNVHPESWGSDLTSAYFSNGLVKNHQLEYPEPFDDSCLWLEKTCGLSGVIGPIFVGIKLDAKMHDDFEVFPEDNILAPLCRFYTPKQSADGSR